MDHDSVQFTKDGLAIYGEFVDSRATPNTIVVRQSSRDAGGIDIRAIKPNGSTGWPLLNREQAIQLIAALRAGLRHQYGDETT